MAAHKRKPHAPDRINLYYNPRSGERAGQRKELPLRLLVMGDFSSNNQTDLPLAERESHDIRRSNFADIMAASDIQFEIAVPDCLSDDSDPPKLTLNLAIKQLSDFEPDGLIDNIPALNALAKFRQILVNLKQQRFHSREDWTNTLQRMLTLSPALTARLVASLAADET